MIAMTKVLITAAIATAQRLPDPFLPPLPKSSPTLRLRAGVRTGQLPQSLLSPFLKREDGGGEDVPPTPFLSHAVPSQDPSSCLASVFRALCFQGHQDAEKPHGQWTRVKTRK